jgi:hypothetical protein
MCSEDDQTRSENDRRVFAGLNEIRSACQYLQGLVINPATTRTVNAALLTQIDAKVTPALNGIRQIFEQDARETEWAADCWR